MGKKTDVVNTERRQIRAWMFRNVEQFVDECGEVNCTRMVEAWDDECASGEVTLDIEHVAWEVAVDVAFQYGERNNGSSFVHRSASFVRSRRIGQ